MGVRFSLVLMLLLSMLLLFVWQSMSYEQRLHLWVALGLYSQQGEVIEEPAPIIPAESPSIFEPLVIAEQHSPFCFKPQTREVTDVKNQPQVFKWVDDKGRVSFSDKKNSRGSKAQDLSAQYQIEKQFFRIDIQAADGSLPVFMKDHLSADLKQMFAVLSRDLSDEFLKQVDLNVRVFNSSSDFEAYRQLHVPNLQTDTGFYKSSMDEAVVMHHGDGDSTRSVARHEATHVINSGLYGITPTWFNEGSAEYFENLVVQGQGKTIFPAAYWMKLLNTRYHEGKLPTLDEYLAIDGGDWRKGDQETMYAIAWSLVHFMMGDNVGRETLREMMRHMAEFYCKPFDSVEFINKYHVGGLNALSAGWEAAVANSEFTPHRY